MPHFVICVVLLFGFGQILKAMWLWSAFQTTLKSGAESHCRV